MKTTLRKAFWGDHDSKDQCGVLCEESRVAVTNLRDRLYWHTSIRTHCCGYSVDIHPQTIANKLTEIRNG